MTRTDRGLLILILLIIASLCTFLYIRWSSNELSLHVGKTYTDVVEDSTFPVKRNTAFYPGATDNKDGSPHPSSTWISRPTIIKFDDPNHGFVLPETAFGAVAYQDLKVATLTTSPMLKTMSFPEAVERLIALQETFKNRDWKLKPRENNNWFKLQSPTEINNLQLKLFTQADGIGLYVKDKYSLLLLIKCYAHCDERNTNTAKYLIDVSIGPDRPENSSPHTTH